MLYHSLLLYFNLVPVVLAQIGPPIEPNADILPAFNSHRTIKLADTTYGGPRYITNSLFFLTLVAWIIWSCMRVWYLEVPTRKNSSRELTQLLSVLLNLNFISALPRKPVLCKASP